MTMNSSMKIKGKELCLV